MRKYVNHILILNIIVQSAIIVTGATVRVTGSGLGCPTWPQCIEGSYVPTVHQAQTWHKWIEFGNRSLTGVLMIVAALVVIAVFQYTTDKTMRVLSFSPLILTVGQAILGGITVLTGLSPITVSAHFILSAAIVTLSVKLWWTYKGHSIPTIHRVINKMANIIFVVAAAVVILGVITTGSGPHSGDINAENRFGFDPRVIAWLHADAVWLFVGLIIALWILRALKQLPQSSNRYLQAVTHITIVQAIVGYTQFFTGLPALLVAIHVALAATLWAYVNVLVLSMKLPSE